MTRLATGSSTLATNHPASGTAIASRRLHAENPTMIGPDALADIYRDLHSNPELSFAETRTAGIVADFLNELGFEVTPGVGGTGVIGILRNGDGATALLRADMDALPVREETGLPYASTVTTTDAAGSEVPVMHACGHDIHVTCLLGACAELAAHRDTWSGTLAVIFQPAEEVAGARAVVDDAFADKLPPIDVVLGQHVAPIPAGVIGLRSGPAFAASDTVDIVMRGEGSHGSRPEASVDPIVMGAAVVMRLQTIVAREIAPTSESAVVTVGTFHAGSKENIIPSEARLGLTVRTYTDDVRDRVLAAIGRIARGEAIASGATEEPLVEVSPDSFPVLVNDPDAVERTRTALAASGALIVDPGLVSGSEDVGLLATAVNAPLVYWLLGGQDPADYEGATTIEELHKRMAELPANHSPYFAPVIEPTLTNGVNALVAAAKEWLPPQSA